MNQTTDLTPTTLAQVQALPNHVTARSHAEATVLVAAQLTTPGPITSKKLFLDRATNKLVYEFYRVRDKDSKVYVIF